MLFYREINSYGQKESRRKVKTMKTKLNRLSFPRFLGRDDSNDLARIRP